VTAAQRIFFLMGDFNYPEFDWRNQTCHNTEYLNCKAFLECTEDNFVFQHVQCPTHANEILDLVRTDELWCLTKSVL